MTPKVEYITNGYVENVSYRLHEAIDKILETGGDIIAVNMYPCDMDDSKWWTAVVVYE